MDNDEFNNKMKSVKNLEIDLVHMLGEDEDYITNLEVSYINMYLVKEDIAPDECDYLNYLSNFRIHLLDIVQVKHPEYYSLFKERYLREC